MPTSEGRIKDVENGIHEAHPVLVLRESAAQRSCHTTIATRHVPALSAAILRVALQGAQGV